VRFSLEYGLVSAVERGMRMLPMTLVRAAGTLLGYTAYVFDRSHRRVALENLAKAFPSRTPSERRAIARRMFVHFGRLVLELMKFATFSEEQMRAHSEIEARIAWRRRIARGAACSSSPAISATGKCRRSRIRFASRQSA
jgi:lauroyl/myristoyl acyltransferase